MAFKDVLKLLDNNGCQQKPDAECNQPARPAPGYVKDALPPAEQLL
jgi:hypothetical protein